MTIINNIWIYDSLTQTTFIGSYDDQWLGIEGTPQATWSIATQSQIDSYNLSKIISNLQSKLISYYNSQDVWIITVQQGKYSFSRQDCDWWEGRCNAIVTSQTTAQFTPYDKKGNPMPIDATPVSSQQIITQELTIRQNISNCYQSQIITINALTNLTDAQNYDFMPAFNAINKLITL